MAQCVYCDSTGCTGCEKIWGVYNHNGTAVGCVTAKSESEALNKVAKERGFKNVDEALAESHYWVEEVDA